MVRGQSCPITGDAAMLDTMVTVTVHGKTELVRVREYESDSLIMPTAFKVEDWNRLTFNGATVDDAIEQLRTYYCSM